MKKTVEEHASRFDEHASEYDENQNEREEYRACANLVIEHAAPHPKDTVLDLGTGTGAIGLALASSADHVVGRDISEGMMEQAKEKAEDQGIENIEFGTGTFREPHHDAADIVVSNFAMHHLSDDEKREAIEEIAALGPRRFVLGDVMFFGTPDPEEPFYSPEVDDPATVGLLADALTDTGFSLTTVEKVHEQVGVLVAERASDREQERERSNDEHE
jgi:cyclopropane fatty-acyl-phospholipid synthase-like methyltransferase